MSSNPLTFGQGVMKSDVCIMTEPWVTKLSATWRALDWFRYAPARWSSGLWKRAAMRSLLAVATLRMLGLCVLVIVVPGVALAADNGAAEFAKGWDLLKIKKYQEARAALESRMKKNPSNALAQFYLADACRD